MNQGRDRLLKIVVIVGVILVGVLLIYQVFLKPKSKTTSNTSGNTDANGNPLVEYIPTTTIEGNTLNYNYAAEGDAWQIIPLGTPPGGSPPPAQRPPGPEPGPPQPIPPHPPIPPGPVPPHPMPPQPIPPPQPPVPAPGAPPPANPPTSGGGPAGVPPPAPPRMTSYTIVHGDTLASIAAKYHTTASAIYAANKATIDAWAARYNFPIKHNPAWGNYPAAMDNIFPGETLHIPL